VAQLGQSVLPKESGPIDLGWRARGVCRSCRSNGRRDPRARDLPRKEVIQPQLPLRLPCYDFVPITNPTLDTSVPCGFGQWLQVLPAFMT
jgi:hypothetical protein